MLPQGTRSLTIEFEEDDKRLASQEEAVIRKSTLGGNSCENLGSKANGISILLRVMESKHTLLHEGVGKYN